jgi:lysophospholipase L1-like esterase
MPLNTVAITGTFNFPDATWTQYARAAFYISGFDTDGEVVSPEPITSNLTNSGGLNVQLWPNQSGIRGTTYNVYVDFFTDATYTKLIKRVDFGKIQISGPAQIQNLLSVPITVPEVWYLTITEDQYLAAINAVEFLGGLVGQAQTYVFTSTAAQTTFSGPDNNSNSLLYQPGRAVVFRNGVHMVPGVDYIEPTENSLVFQYALDAGDTVVIVPSSYQAAAGVDRRADATTRAISDRVIFGPTSPTAGSNATATQYAHAIPMPRDGVVRTATVASNAAGIVEIGVFSRDGAVFSRVRWVARRCAIGVNNFDVDLPIAKGQYIGFRTATGGVLTFIAGANAGHFNGALTGETFTDADNLPSVTNTIQIGWAVDLYSDPEVDLEFLKDQSFTDQTIGKKTDPATGSNWLAGTTVFAEPIAEDGILEYIRYFSRAGRNGSVALFELRGAVMTRVEILADPVTFYPGLNTVQIRKLVKKGQFIGFQAATSAWVDFIATADGSPYYYNSNATLTSFTPAPVPSTANTIQLQAVFSVLREGTVHRVTIGNADKVLFIGPSYTLGNYNHRGKHWPAKVSLFSPYNCEVYALGGETYASILARIRNNDPIAGWGHLIGPQDYGTTYVVLMLGWNDFASGTLGVSFDDFLTDIRQMIETIRSLGAVPILSTEWQPVYDTTNPSTHVAFAQIADDMGVPFVNLIPNTLKFRGPPFLSRIWQGTPTVNHPGVRTNHIISDEVERQLATILPARPRQAIKIFRKREGVTVTDIDDDLMFGDSFERAKSWRELFLNQVSLAVADERYYDTLADASQYDQNQIVGSQYLRLRAGQRIEVPDYVLIDAVLDAQVADLSSVTLVLTDPDVEVWVKDALAGAPYPADGASVCRWTPVTGDNGRYTVDRLPGKVHRDNVSFLLFKSGGPWGLGEPYIEYRGNRCKQLALPSPVVDARGASVVAVPDFDASITGWTTTGSPGTSTDDTVRQFPENVSRVLVLGSADSVQQSLDYTPDPSKDRLAEITVTAQRNPPLFDISDDYATAPITQDTFDWAKVTLSVVSATGGFVMPQSKKVGMFWADIRFRVLIPARVDPVSIRLTCDRDIEIATVTGRFVEN